MKIQLDTDNKVIKIDESINFGELVETLEKLLPEGKWKEFKLEAEVQVNWANPVITKEVPYQKYLLYQKYPWWEQQPMVTYLNNSSDIKYELKSGIYNIEL